MTDEPDWLKEAEETLSTTSESSVGSPELEYFEADLDTKKLSENTRKSYRRQYKNLYDALQKPIHTAGQELIMKTVDNLTTNNNSKAALLNIGLMVRKLYMLDVGKLEKHRALLKKSIISDSSKQNVALASHLPSIEEFEQYIDAKYHNKKYPEFIVNFLMRYVYVRNLDLVFDVVRLKRDMNDDSKNYMWVGKGNKVTYVRNVYKTAGVYGQKINVFTGEQGKRLATALRALKGPLIPNPNNVGYFVKLWSFNQLGEGALTKVVVNHFRVAGDLNTLAEISKSRGTDLCTIATSYNIQT